MRIGFIGLGAMGLRMAERLVSAGFDLSVHNRTKAKEEPLAALGADRAVDPAEAAYGADMTILMVSATQDVEQVLFGGRGVAGSATSGSIVIDMSTIDPHATQRFAARLGEAGIEMLDAPVSGGTEGAAAGTLSIMVGGRAEVLARARPVLEHLGKKIVHVGGHGSGQFAKAVNQVVIAGTYLGLAEGLQFAKRSGIDTGKLIEALKAGAASSWILDHRSANILEERYPLGFKVSLHRKDLAIAVEAASMAGLRLEGATHVARLEDELIARGLGDADVSAIAEAVADDANRSVPSNPPG